MKYLSKKLLERSCYIKDSGFGCVIFGVVLVRGMVSLVWVLSVREDSSTFGYFYPWFIRRAD